MTTDETTPLRVGLDLSSINEEEELLEEKKSLLQQFKEILSSPSAIILLALVIIGTINRVSFRIMLVSMRYSFFLNLLTSFIYIPVFTVVVEYQRKYTDKITDGMTSFPKKYFLLMGFFDATAGLLLTIGGAQTSGPMQNLLLQFAIPVTMVLAWKFIPGQTYTVGQIAGAFGIISGIVVALWPSLSGTTTSGEQSTVLGIVLFLVSAFPQAISSIIKERVFSEQEDDMNIYYLNLWVAIFQFLWSLLYLPITAIPAFGGLAFSHMPDAIWFGLRCLFGFNSTPGDNCAHAWIPTSIYMTANIFYNISLLLVLQTLGAAIFYLCSSIILPLVNVCFTIPFLVGKLASPLTVFDIIGLIAILIGLGMYRYFAKKPTPEEEEENRSHGGITPRARALSVPVISFAGGPIDVPIQLSTPRRRGSMMSNSSAPRDSYQIRQAYYQRLGVLDRSPLE